MIFICGWYICANSNNACSIPSAFIRPPPQVKTPFTSRLDSGDTAVCSASNALERSLCSAMGSPLMTDRARGWSATSNQAN